MKSGKTLAFLTTFLALAGALTAQPALREPNLLRGFWESPQFVERFLGSYGFQGGQEPSITAQERDLLRRLVEIIPQNLPEAANLLERSIRPDSSAALDFTLGNIYFQLDRLADARRAYEAAVQKFPGFVRAHKNLGMVHIQQESLEPAVAAFTRALELGGGDGSTYGLIGYAHLQLDRPVSAEAAYRQALLFEAAQTNWRQGLARSLQIQERHREAAALLAELIAQEPTRPEHLLFQANAFIALDDQIRAAQNLEIVRRMGAIPPEALLTLGDIYLNQDLIDIALGAYQQSLRDAPRQAASRALRAAEVLAQRERQREALELVTAVEQVEEGLDQADRIRRQRIQARLSLAEDDPAQAVALLEDLLLHAPMDGEALLLLARAQTAMGQPERAELSLQRAADVRGFTAAALRQHGELLARQRRFSEALDHLRQAQALEPRGYVADYIEQVERLARIQAEQR